MKPSHPCPDGGVCPNLGCSLTIPTCIAPPTLQPNSLHSSQEQLVLPAKFPHIAAPRSRLPFLDTSTPDIPTVRFVPRMQKTSPESWGRPYTPDFRNTCPS